MGENVEETGSILPGTLDLLVMKVLASQPMHGWGIGERLSALSGEAFEVNQGSLYPALQRLRRQGWIQAEWQRSEANRRARYYSLTPAGAKRLQVELKAWKRASSAVERILAWDPGQG